MTGLRVPDAALAYSLDIAPLKAQMRRHGHFASKDTAMAKGQKKSSREARKPKAEKPAKPNASQPSLKPGGIKGLEHITRS